MSCRLPVPWPLAAVLVPLRSRNSITLLICHFTASFQCESLPGIGVEHELFSLLNTTFEGTPHTDLEDLESVTEKVSDCWTASYGLRFRDHETDKPRLADFRTARHAVGAVARRRAGLGPRARRPIISRVVGRRG